MLYNLYKAESLIHCPEFISLFGGGLSAGSRACLNANEAYPVIYSPWRVNDGYSITNNLFELAEVLSGSQ
jgi:hypothetical protein